jgi:hypothetical protein
MRELIYDEVVEVAGFDPERDVGEPWSLKAAKQRLNLFEQLTIDAAEARWRLEELLADLSSGAPLPEPRL